MGSHFLPKTTFHGIYIADGDYDDDDDDDELALRLLNHGQNLLI